MQKVQGVGEIEAERLPTNLCTTKREPETEDLRRVPGTLLRFDVLNAKIARCSAKKEADQGIDAEKDQGVEEKQATKPELELLAL